VKIPNVFLARYLLRVSFAVKELGTCERDPPIKIKTVKDPLDLLAGNRINSLVMGETSLFFFLSFFLSS
jgi:hypothetical protein